MPPWSSTRSNPALLARRAASTNLSLMCRIPSRSRALGVRPKVSTAEGATGSAAPANLPAWLIWRHASAPSPLMAGGQPCQTVEIVVRIRPEGPIGTAPSRVIDGSVFHHHHGDPAPGHEPVMVQQQIAHGAAQPGVAQIGRRHGEPVLECQVADRQ